MSEDKYPSRDLAFEWEHRAYERLADVAEKIDNKAIAMFSIGSLIIGILATMTKEINFNWTVIPLILACISYIYLAWKTVKAFYTYKIIVSENPAKLKEKYWHLPQDEAKEKYWTSLEEACEYNKDLVENKGKALTAAIPALGIEVVLLAIWLFLRSVS